MQCVTVTDTMAKYLHKTGTDILSCLLVEKQCVVAPQSDSSSQWNTTVIVWSK